MRFSTVKPHPRTWKAIAALMVVVAILPIRCGHTIEVPRVAVDRIRVRDGVRHTEVIVTDSVRIKKSVEFIGARRKGWRKPWDTFPTPRYDVVFESNGGGQFVLWIGREGTAWIGYRGDGGSGAVNVLKNISVEERAELLGDLGL